MNQLIAFWLKLLRWFDSRIIAHSGWEMIFMRLGFAALVYYTIPPWILFDSQPHPNGLAHWIDFTFLSNHSVLGVLRLVLVLSLAGYVLNLASLPCLTFMLFLSVAYGSLINSQGAISHSLQPVSLVILAQWLVALWQLGRQGWRACYSGLDLPSNRMLIHAAKVALVSCYVVSAVSKIEKTNGTWAWRVPNLAVQLVKTTEQDYYNELKPRPEWNTQVVDFMQKHPNWTRVIIGPALFLELLAFLALINRAWAFLIGVSLITMHLMISLIMQLHFFEMEMLNLIFLVNLPFLACAVWRYFASSSGKSQKNSAFVI